MIYKKYFLQSVLSRERSFKLQKLIFWVVSSHLGNIAFHNSSQNPLSRCTQKRGSGARQKSLFCNILLQALRYIYKVSLVLILGPENIFNLSSQKKRNWNFFLAHKLREYCSLLFFYFVVQCFVILLTFLCCKPNPDLTKLSLFVVFLKTLQKNKSNSF